MKISRNKQAGFSAIIAVILVVLFALLGTYMATLSNIGSLNTTQSLASMQAWFATKSGFEWAVYDAIHNGAVNLNCNAGGPSFTLGGGAADGYKIQITCTTSPVTEASSTYIVYALTSVADRNSVGTITYVSRTIKASITDAP